ncbi:nucleotidyltransferase domain-containing protein [Caminibacter sp.]
MRLKSEEIEFIRFLAKKHFNSENVYIFGSRIDDNKRGGDIDIYIETNLKNTLKAKLKFLTEYEMKFGLQKIDLVVNNHTQNLPIFEIAKKGIKL